MMMRCISSGCWFLLLILAFPIRPEASPASRARDAVDRSMARLWAGQAKFEPYLQLQIATSGPVK